MSRSHDEENGAYCNKSRDHAKKKNTISITVELEVLGDEPSGASSPILASLISAVRRIDPHSEPPLSRAAMLILRFTRPCRHPRTDLRSLNSRRSHLLG